MVEPPGAITTSNDPGRAFIREATGRRGHATIKRVFGFDWSALSALAEADGETEAKRGLLVRAEPMLDRVGRMTAILVRAEGPLTSGTATSAATSVPKRGLDRIAGTDAAVRTGLALAERFARTALPVLIIAEAGAGTRDLVETIHQASAFRARPIVTLEAASVDGPLAKIPSVATLSMGGGTLFIDGIDDLKPLGQSELLSALEHGGLGDVRFIGSARSELRPLVLAGRFDRALYQLLRSATVTLPRLRDRSDKVLLAERVLGAIAPSTTLSPATRAAIERYAFPGNLLELETAMEHASALAGGQGRLDPFHLPPEMTDKNDGPHDGAEGTKSTAERTALEEAMRFGRGNLSVTAKRLGVARSTLYRMLERHGMRSA